MAPSTSDERGEFRFTAPEGSAVEARVLTRGARLEGKVVSSGTRAPIAGARVSVESGMSDDALAPLFDAVRKAGQNSVTELAVPRKKIGV